MIKINYEGLLSIPAAARSLPKRPNGKHLHPSTLWRWIRRGIRGVRLETVKLGGLTYTSKEALQRFTEGLSGAASQSLVCDAAPEAESVLTEAGILGPGGEE